MRGQVDDVDEEVKEEDVLEGTKSEKAAETKRVLTMRCTQL